MIIERKLKMTKLNTSSLVNLWFNLFIASFYGCDLECVYPSYHRGNGEAVKKE